MQKENDIQKDPVESTANNCGNSSNANKISAQQILDNDENFK